MSVGSKLREDLGSSRRVIGGGRGVGKLEPFVPLLPVARVEASDKMGAVHSQTEVVPGPGPGDGTYCHPEGKGPPSPTGHRPQLHLEP